MNIFGKDKQMDCHVCLIFTPIDRKYRNAFQYTPPLGLVALENFIHRLNPKVRITILDGGPIHSLDEIIEFIEKERPDFVGQSVMHKSYENALIIADYARQYGAKNIFGGHHISQLCDAIAFRQSALVDYVVYGDGEMALWKIINNSPLEEIPNLAINDNGTIRKTPAYVLDLNDSPLLDYSNIDLSPYMQLLELNNSSSGLDSGSISNYMRVYSHKGCGNRIDGKGCLFCGRYDSVLRFKPPEKYWQEMSYVVDSCNADYVFDVGDDLLYNVDWLRKAAETKPVFKNEFRFGIFGRAIGVTKESVDLLRKIGVEDVAIGFESGDERVLRKSNKRNTTPLTNIAAAKELFQSGIIAHVHYVLGLPGEDKSSLRKTVDDARAIAELSMSILGSVPGEIVANLIEPCPGSPIYRALTRAYPDKYLYNDRLSLDELQRDYFRHFFNLESQESYLSFRNELALIAREIMNGAPDSGAQGWTELGD